MPGKPGTLAERFWPKVDKAGPAHPTLGTPCWIWTAARKPEGYGVIGAGVRGSGVLRAHRVAYELVFGPIPEGLTLDHRCVNPPCVNPAHMEPVTNVVNVMRGSGVGPTNAAKTECPKGHPFTEENTIREHSGRHRKCRTCRNARKRAAWTHRKARA